MRRSIVYRDKHVAELQDAATLRSALAEDGVLLWVDILTPDDSDVAVLRDEFHFHPLSIEDALREEQRAKVDEYAGYNLIVLFDLSLENESEQVHPRELTVFVGPKFVVTVHQEEIRCLDELLGATASRSEHH